MILLCAANLHGSGQSSPVSQETRAQARVAFTHGLSRLNGGHPKVSVVEVTYPPGGSSPPHSHPCPVIGYVIEGTLKTQVKGEAEAIYRAGESSYEAPNGVHQVSANASEKDRARLLAYFVCDRETALSVAPHEPPAAAERQ